MIFSSEPKFGSREIFHIAHNGLTRLHGWKLKAEPQEKNCIFLTVRTASLELWGTVSENHFTSF